MGDKQDKGEAPPPAEGTRETAGNTETPPAADRAGFHASRAETALTRAEAAMTRGLEAAEQAKEHAETAQNVAAAVKAAQVEDAKEDAKDRKASRRWRGVLVVVLIGILGLTSYFLTAISINEYDKLTAAIDTSDLLAACRLHYRANLHAAFMTFAVRFAAVGLGGLLSLLGGFFVLVGPTQEYKAEASGPKDTKIALTTASPGLVMLTIGVVLAGFAVNHEQTLTLDSSLCATLDAMHHGVDVPLPLPPERPGPARPAGCDPVMNPGCDVDGGTPGAHPDGGTPP